MNLLTSINYEFIDINTDRYVKTAVKNVQMRLQAGGRQLVRKASTSMPTSYRPELDISDELPENEATYYQNLIGILRWIVELGRIDIHMAVAMMSHHLALP